MIPDFLKPGLMSAFGAMAGLFLVMVVRYWIQGPPRGPCK